MELRDVQLVSALKKGTTCSLMSAPEVKSEILEGVHVVDVDGASPSKPLAKGPALVAASTLNPIFPLSRYAQAT